MKIAASVQLMPADKPRVAAQSGDTERQADSFAELLAAMRFSQRGDNGQKSGEAGPILLAQEDIAEVRAADFAPEIGTAGKAFGHGRLLVDTAVFFRDLADVTSGHCLSVPLFAALERPGEQAGAAIPTLAGKTFGSFLVDWLATAFPPASHTGELPFRLSAQTAIYEQAPRQSNGSKAPAAVQARPGVAGENEPVSVAGSSASASSTRTQKSSSPFGAQLIAFEGGLRLLLRLPRLADGERAELDAGLTRLFESFGHRNHEIVIHEIDRGDS